MSASLGPAPPYKNIRQAFAYYFNGGFVIMSVFKVWAGTASVLDFIGLIMKHTLDRTYDGIVIGAGHHGLILGSYLAKAGLDILLVDKRLRYGGGLSTEEVTAPGFFHNLDSINHFHIAETPWFKDLALAERVSYITPRYELGQPHLDGSALVFGRDLEETLANVARFSKKDAATFREWNRRAEEITRRIFLPERYSEPLPQPEREALLAQSTIGREFLAITKRQPSRS
jgi:phytoene dehydrogenase-like protein